MSDDGLGKYTFLPWIRQGISTQLGAPDGTPVLGRATVQAAVSIEGGSESTTDPAPSVTIDVLGPADIKGFDTRAITRVWPKADVFEVEPNYFPLLELFPADIAWRYNPAKADAQGRLRPWLALIVLRDDEIDTVTARTLTTKPHAPLPPFDQLWAWAHVHVDAADAVDVPAMQGLLDSAAHRVVARLVCPRRLDQDTAYTVFLVPTLEATRRSVLGQSVGVTFDVSQPAWKNDGSAVTLPVFYSWRFQTSDTGDFASLAKRIVPQALPATAGQRAMDVAEPGMGRAPAASAPLAVESALRPLDAVPTPWDAGEQVTWTESLAALLDLPADRISEGATNPTLTPPLYGRWYAAAPRLDATAPPWFQDLNADPRTRVVAAMGWQVVQNAQPQLLAGAWAQVDAVRAANMQLRFAQLAREAAMRLYARNVLPLADAQLLALATPLHARVLVPLATEQRSLTLRALVQRSPLRSGVLAPAFRKLARPLGPVGVRQARTKPSLVVERLNSGAMVVAPPPPTPMQMVTPASAGASLAPPWLTSGFADWLAKVPRPLWYVIEKLLELVLAVWPHFANPKLRAELEDFLTEIRDALGDGASPGERIALRASVRDGAVTAAQIHDAPTRFGFVARALQADGTLASLPATTHAEDSRFRLAAATAFGNITAPASAGETLHPVNLTAAIATIKASLDPSVTIGATFGHGRLGGVATLELEDSLDPVMAAPTFPQPMYRPLADVSTDWILSGLEDLPGDLASLAHPNERFIESYMTGLNDEMGRTLLFNEYPTDQRGTYFRQFWDTTSSPDPSPDINAIADWPRGNGLGENSTRPGIDSYLVLVVRAELLRRYPNTIVYAVGAAWGSAGTRSISEPPVELNPDFQGTLGDGMRFWAFKLTVDDARGGNVPGGPAGWYFALQEHSSEPRFGLEPARTPFASSPTTWQALAWSDLANDATALEQLAYIDLGAALPSTTTITDVEDARWHAAKGARASDLAYTTYREPVRLLVHASRMIPPDA